MTSVKDTSIVAWERCQDWLARLTGVSPLKRLCRAIHRGQVDRVRTLLDRGVVPLDSATHHAITIGSRRHDVAWSLCHHAVDSGHLAVLELLLERGAPPDQPSPWSRPSHAAARQGREDMMALLERHGADLNHPMPSQSTYWEDDPYTPSALALFRDATGRPYEPAAWSHVRQEQLKSAVGPLPAPVPVPRPRF